MLKRNYASRLTHARLEGGPETFALEFGPGVTVLCGGNGAGKSRTLGALIRCLASGEDVTHQAYLPETPHWLSSVSVTGTTRDAEWTIDFDGTDHKVVGEGPASVVYIDPSAETERLIRRFSDDDNREDLKEGVDPAPLNDRDVEWVGYILRRSYSAIRVYEVTAFSEDDDPTPYFEVDAHGQTYDLLGMGRGELAATYLLWRLRNLDPGTIVLIEEPESHLASFSQTALMEAVVEFAVDCDLTMVISSHSPSMINALPEGNVVLLKGAPEHGVRAGLGIPEITRFLGIPAARDIIALVEDRTAGHMLRSVLESMAPDLANAVAIRYANSGESGVRRTLTEVRSFYQDGFAVVGVLDGDQRGTAADEFGFLLGNAAPEVVLREALEVWRADQAASWAPRLPGGADRLRMVLEMFTGRDHHDWLAGLGQEYGSTAQVVEVALDLVLLDEQHKDHAFELVNWLREKRGR